jgi:hypothetical protein
MILLHGNDEKWIQGTMPPLRHFHCSGMHPDAMDKVVMSIMFRHIEATALVDRETNRLINPPVCADIAEFDAIRDTWQNEPAAKLAMECMVAVVEETYNTITH